MLRDKALTEFSLEYPEDFLSAKAIARRAKQGLRPDSTDLPVCNAYIEEIRHLGFRIVCSGKWENFVTVACNDSSLIAGLTDLPFVKSVELVWKASDTHVRIFPAPDKQIPLVEYNLCEAYYGTAENQIKMCGGEWLHKSGYWGEGVTVAVIDAGFYGVDNVALFDSLSLLGVKNFIDDVSAEAYPEESHGLKVLSCMAANRPYVMVGTAPKADYWLLLTEDGRSEHLVEQDYWAAAIEFADSVGVDVANVSLGYSHFDDKSKNYRLCDLDGQTALISRQASRAADKGMLLCLSAGNSGGGSWKKLTVPGDAKSVITVGAVDEHGILAPFSSIGNSADGRIKPDVVALGQGTSVVESNGLVTTANGTSFATPTLCGMIACLWQARPELTARQLITLVRMSADRADFPDNIYGYGLPDFKKALLYTGVIEEAKE